jgi:hypothetical protein
MRSDKPRLAKRFATLVLVSISRLAALQQQPVPGSLAETGIIQGRVLDETGAAVTAAPVNLNSEPGESHSRNTDSEGSYSFSAVPAGHLTLTITVPGFASFTSPPIRLSSDQRLTVPDITLHLATVPSHVEVTASRRDVAEAQLQSEVKQRLLGFLPNFYTVYYKDPIPLNAGQKMRLSLRLAVDPVSFGMAGVQAALETNSKNYAAYGTGAEGFGKRYAAAYADDFIGTMVGSGLFPVLFRQDPRYYYKGTGSVGSRVLYALSWSFRCKGDNGKWQFNYSGLLGEVASAAISNLYYPKEISNSAAETAKYSMLNFASQGVSALLQEFLFKKMTTHSKDPGKL